MGGKKQAGFKHCVMSIYHLSIYYLPSLYCLSLCQISIVYLPSIIYLSSSINSEKAMAPHSSTFAWKIPWMEEPGRLQSMESLRVGHD